MFAGAPSSGRYSPNALWLHGVSGVTSARELARTRQQEDIAACTVLGAHARHFAFHDAAYRTRDNGTFLYQNLQGDNLAPEDEGLVERIASALLNEILESDVILAPLGVGRHVDHLLIRKVAELLPQSQLIYYPEIPYALNVPEQIPALSAGLSGFDYAIEPVHQRAWEKAAACYTSQARMFEEAGQSIGASIAAAPAAGCCRLYSVTPGFASKVFSIFERQAPAGTHSPSIPDSDFQSSVWTPQSPDWDGSTLAAAVVVPVFNRLDLLRATVETLKAQTLQQIQFIIVDDRSDADTRTYLERLAAKDTRFLVIHKPDGMERGPQSSRNIGLDACTAETVMFLDSDDLISPTCVQERLELLRQNPHADIVIGSQVHFIDGEPGLKWVNLPRPDIPDIERFLKLASPLDVPWVCGAGLFRTHRLRENRLRWRTEFDWDDVAFHFECLVAGLKAVWLPGGAKPDFFYRDHSGERRGRSLFTAYGIRTTAKMIAWMCERLRLSDMLTPSRHDILKTSFFHTCALRAIDAGDDALADEVTRSAATLGLLNGDEVRRIIRFRRGRTLLRRHRRISYYWDRMNRRELLHDFFPEISDRETYSTVSLQSDEAAAAWRQLTRSTASTEPLG